MSDKFTYIADLAKQQEVPMDGIISRTIYVDEQVKAVLFGFGKDQELSEHNSSMAAIIQIIEGEATLTLGDETIEAKSGSWIVMPPLMQHSLYAKTPVVMLLLLLKG
ncbi:MAG: cupin domain-containing protein [Chloroflexota bacterium]|nr:cupin domain-containing protein [Chloroflexota bacterium]